MSNIILSQVDKLEEIDLNTNLLIEQNGSIVKYRASALQEEIDNAQNSLQENINSMNELESLITGLSTTIRDLEQEIAKLTHDNSSLPAQINNNTDEIENLFNRITPIESGGTAAETAQEARKNLGCKMDCLYGGGGTWNTGTVTLSKPYTDYDIIVMVYSHSGENVAAGAGYVFSTCYPVPILKDIQAVGAYFATFGYSTRYRRYSIPDIYTFKDAGNGSTGTTGMIGVYGLKCS